MPLVLVAGSVQVQRSGQRIEEASFMTIGGIAVATHQAEVIAALKAVIQ